MWPKASVLPVHANGTLGSNGIFPPSWSGNYRSVFSEKISISRRIVGTCLLTPSRKFLFFNLPMTLQIWKERKKPIDTERLLNCPFRSS